MKDLPLVKQADIKPSDVVFVRIDCNVPLNADGSIADTFRLEVVTPTLQYLKDKEAKIIIAGAIGRPHGKRDESLTTKCIAQYFDNILGRCVYIDQAYGPKVVEAIESIQPGQAVMLENLRFWIEEETNAQTLGKDLASLADAYVNDAFGQSHRNQASIVAITQHLDSYAGLCLEKEIDSLQVVLNPVQSPVLAIVGGAKVSDKLGVIEALLEKCDNVLIGGAMAYTFLKGQGVSIGKSLCEDEFVEKTICWMESGKIILPRDSVIAEGIDSTETSISSEIDNDHAGFDIGPVTIENFSQYISEAKVILWNGPMGVFEKPQFAQGTNRIGNAVASSSGFSVVGGGDSVAAIRSLKLADKIDHVSSGGGATLEYIESGTLVGIDALMRNAERKTDA